MKVNMNGKRLEKAKNTGERIKELEVALSNTEMANRISQMMLKQILDQFQNLRRDMDNTMGIINDIQYRTIAMLDVANVDKDALDARAEELKLVDYNKASDQEDITKGYILDNEGTINEKSIVIITSSTDGDENKGIFRSKFNISECQTETLRAKFLGAKVGDVFTDELNGENHTITVLGLRKVKEEENAAE